MKYQSLFTRQIKRTINLSSAEFALTTLKFDTKSSEFKFQLTTFKIFFLFFSENML